MTNNVLVTGAAGFIGHHFCKQMLRSDVALLGLDNFDPFYDRSIKEKNLKEIKKQEVESAGTFEFKELDILARNELRNAYESFEPDGIVHFAAAAGVRRSREKPVEYLETNVTGTGLLLEHAREANVDKFVFVSSSSVYGNHSNYPFSEDLKDLEPISPYGVTKRSAEMFCRTYHEHYGLDIAVIRPFTVYGPRQRPDMAIHKFTKLIDREEPIPFYGDGTTERDYTYVTDIVNGIQSALHWNGEWGIFNLGGSRSITLDRLVELLGKNLGKKPKINRQPLPPGDVSRTLADISRAREAFNYEPEVNIEDGIDRFVSWYQREKESNESV